jgi:hypothetical protein
MRILLVLGLLFGLTLTSAAAQRSDASRAEREGLSSVLPPGWTLQPPDPDWRGKRLISPDRRGWLAVYEAPADRSVADHMKAVASAEGERITYLRRGRGWIVVSGFKGDRIFYRKAMLACGDTRWHHVAFEYPAAQKRAYDRFVTRASRALGAHRNDGCNPRR